MTTQQDRITAAARALCRQSALECGVLDEDSHWRRFGHLFRADAKAAIAAADAVGEPKRKIKSENETLKTQVEVYSERCRLFEDTLTVYRARFGVLGAKQ